MKLQHLGSVLCLLGAISTLAVRHEPGALHLRAGDTHGSFAALIVGGGPDRHNNQAGIESNVRYVGRLLPAECPRRVLFADGDRSSKSVYCEGSSHTYYREPQIERIDGPATNAAVKNEITTLGKSLADQPGTPAMLYFTGHGGGDEDGNYKNNYYCTWKDDQLPVTELAQRIKSIPKTSPIVLIMVECYSGGFANLLFQDGSPTGSMVDRPICGFFAATDYRMSAGCTPEVNEADYKDFTGYFFAALCGVDRLGRPVTGADYNHDGHITMDEAYAYALIHDDSIDTPVCTSDAFLRRYIKTSDPDCFKYRYSDVLSWATPAQRAALQALQRELELDGSGDMAAAYGEFRRLNSEGFDDRVVRLTRFCRLFKSVVLTHELMSSGSAQLQERFKALLALEHSNPFQGDALAMREFVSVGK